MEEAQAGIKITRRNISNLRYADAATLMAESEELKSLLMKVKEESVGFPRQEYWSGLPFPSLGDLPDPGIGPTSPELAGGFFTTAPPGKPHSFI